MISIHNEKQNHPALIVRDIESLGLNGGLRTDNLSNNVESILRRRGVHKWFYVRRLLIQLKERWLHDLHELMRQKEEAKQAGDMRRYHRLAGRVEALSDARQQVRALCHLPRDVEFPANLERIRLPHNFPTRPGRRYFLKGTETITLSGGPHHGERQEVIRHTSTVHRHFQGETHVYFRENKRRRFVWVGVKS